MIDHSVALTMKHHSRSVVEMAMEEKKRLGDSTGLVFRVKFKAKVVVCPEENKKSGGKRAS